MLNARVRQVAVARQDRGADNVVLRCGVPDDLAALQEIEWQTAAMFPPSTLPPELARPLPAEQVAAGLAQARVWVADAAAAGPVGFVIFEFVGGCLHIAEIDVVPSFGRRGIGTRLLARAGSVARERGLRFVTLTTFVNIPWNAPFYARRGFAAVADLAPFPHLASALEREQQRGLRQRVAMARLASEANPGATAGRCA